MAAKAKAEPVEPVEPATLQQVVWLHENHKPSVHDRQASSHPPLWPHETWAITRFEVLENGATLRLWWAAK